MSDFISAIEYVIHENEGGYSLDPDDPGGETNFGICKRDHPALDIKNLTLAQAVDIYRDQYWCYSGINDQVVATKLLDMAVNMEGTGHTGAAVRIAQQAVNCQLQPEGRLRVDGEYGLMTEGAINHCDPVTLLRDMCQLAAEHYLQLIERHHQLTKFQKGWLLRAAKVPPSVPSAANG